MKLIRTKFESGERYSLLIDDNGVPNWYPTLLLQVSSEILRPQIQ
jgi:hypothetical protein